MWGEGQLRPSLPTPGPLPLAWPLLGFRPVGGQPAPDLRAPVPVPAAAGDWPSCALLVPWTPGCLWAPCQHRVTVPPPLLLSRPLRRPGLASPAAPSPVPLAADAPSSISSPSWSPWSCQAHCFHSRPPCGLPRRQVPSHLPPGWPRCPLSGLYPADVRAQNPSSQGRTIESISRHCQISPRG